MKIIFRILLSFFLFLNSGLFLRLVDACETLTNRIMAEVDVFNSEFPVHFQKEVSLTLDSTRWVSDGRGIQLWHACSRNNIVSESALSNKESPWDVLRISFLNDVNKHCCLMFSREVFLVTKHINEGKCMVSLCNSDATFMPTIYRFSSQGMKDLETEGAPDNVNGRSLSESYCGIKCFLNFGTASVRNCFGKFSHNIFCSVSI